MAAAHVENWDDDADFEGGLFNNSLQTLPSAFSARLSLRSESNAGDEDWQVLVACNDEAATQKAILSAKQAGIPIPQNVPGSALLGGTIKRLGKKVSTKQKLDDDWGMDIDLPASGTSPLKLKPQLVRGGSRRSSRPETPAIESDDFDLDWAEGSLGVRFGGTKRELRSNARSSSTSAMSPSMGSCMTCESEEDGLDGLVLPTEPIDFTKILNKRKNVEAAPTSFSPPQHAANDSPVVPSEPSPSPDPRPLPADDDDMLSGLDIGPNLIDPKKLKVNRNIKITSNRIQLPPPRTTTTLTFTDKASTASRIPRPTLTKTSSLAPVFESGAIQITRTSSRPAPTTTNSQLLRSKRSAPLLRSQPQSHLKPSPQCMPPGVAGSKSHRVTHKGSQLSAIRRNSNPDRGQSPPPRPFSRMSRFDGGVAETPSRAGSRRDGVAPAALAREASTKRNIIRPTRRRNFGNGTELDLFDDLPTSAAKENQFVKQPIRVGPPKPNNTLRSHASLSRLVIDRTKMYTPLPPVTPTATVAPAATGTTAMPNAARGYHESTPRFARDTAASRNAREQRLAAAPKPREGPLTQVQTNWKAQVALRNPHMSPTAHRARSRIGEVKKPQLIKWMGAESVRNEKGMTYNLALNRWDGNDDELKAFTHHANTLSSATLPLLPTYVANHSHHHHTKSTPNGVGLLQSHHNNALRQPGLATSLQQQYRRQEPSPPRRAPALISHVHTGNNIQVEKGMVLDPRLMKWLKIAPGAKAGGGGQSPSSVSMEDEEDPFAGIEDLVDDCGKRPESLAGKILKPDAAAGGAGKAASSFAKMDELLVGEEFDIGPGFTLKQRKEEEVWRRRVEGWIGSWRDELGEGWRWSIRERAMEWDAERAVAAAQGR